MTRITQHTHHDRSHQHAAHATAQAATHPAAHHESLVKKLGAIGMAFLMVLALFPHWTASYATTAYADEPTQQDASAQTDTDNNQDNKSGDETANTDASSDKSDDSSASQDSNDTNNSAATDSSDKAAAASSDNASGSSDNSAKSEAPAEPVAAIGSTNFTDLKELMKAVKPGDTITLLKDVDLTGAGTLDISNLTLDLNGHTISAENMSLIFEGSNATIRNGGFSAKGGSYGLFYGDNGTSNNALLENLHISGGVNIFNAGGVTLRNVTADATTSNPYYAVWCDVNAQATIESGNYTSSGPAVVGLADNSSGAPASQLNIKGGNFYSQPSPRCASPKVVLEGANLYKPVISGGTFYSAPETRPYLAQGYDLVSIPDNRWEVVADAGSIKPLDDATIPSQKELVSTTVSDDEANEISKAVQDPKIASALNNTGSTQKLWTVNVVLRDKTTLAEDHTTPETFVLSYPDDIDPTKYDQYSFTVLHIATNEKDGATTHDAEIVDPKDVKPLKEGLQITSTLSPFAITYTLPNEEPTTPTNPDKPTTPTTPTNPTTPSTPDNTNTNNNATTTNTGTNTQQSTTTSETTTATAPQGQIAKDAQNTASSPTATPAMPNFNGTNYNRIHYGYYDHGMLHGQEKHSGMNSDLALIFGLLGAALVAAGVVFIVRERKEHDSNRKVEQH